MYVRLYTGGGLSHVRLYVHEGMCVYAHIGDVRLYAHQDSLSYYSLSSLLLVPTR
jgi:hypothetical protein